MAEVGCGVLPVVDADRRVLGVITDRDICCALCKQDHRPSEARVADSMSEPVFSCTDTDDISTALKIMRSHKVRRLPVVDGGGALLGLVSLDDIALEARAFEADRPDGPYFSQVASTLREIASHSALAVAVPAGPKASIERQAAGSE